MSTILHMYVLTYVVLSTYIKKILSSLCRFSFLIGLISGISGAPTNPQCFVTVGRPKNPEGASCNVMGLIFPPWFE